MAFCEYRKHGECGLSEKYDDYCMRCDDVTSDGCEAMRKMAREDEGGGEMTDTEIIEWLMNTDIPQAVRERCVGLLRAQRYGKVKKYKDQYYYCECGCPVEIMLDGITLKPIGGQNYCDE